MYDFGHISTFGHMYEFGHIIKILLMVAYLGHIIEILKIQDSRADSKNLDGRYNH